MVGGGPQRSAVREPRRNVGRGDRPAGTRVLGNGCDEPSEPSQQDRDRQEGPLARRDQLCVRVGSIASKTSAQEPRHAACHDRDHAKPEPDQPPQHEGQYERQRREPLGDGRRRRPEGRDQRAQNRRADQTAGRSREHEPGIALRSGAHGGRIGRVGCRLETVGETGSRAPVARVAGRERRCVGKKKATKRVVGAVRHSSRPSVGAVCWSCPPVRAR